jgi:hypothetical protein
MSEVWVELIRYACAVCRRELQQVQFQDYEMPDGTTLPHYGWEQCPQHPGQGAIRCEEES